MSGRFNTETNSSFHKHPMETTKDYEDTRTTATRHLPVKLLIFGALALVFAFVAFLAATVIAPSIDSSGSYAVSSSSESSVTYNSGILIYNEYTKNQPLSDRYGWVVVEPYKLTTLEVENPSSENTYIWSVDGWHLGDGPSVTAVFSSPTGETQQVSVEIKNAVGVTTSMISKDVMAKYVRREIRELLEQDRIAFFQAVAVLQRVPTQTGKAIYGKNYYSRDFFNRIHQYFGGSQSCDHWHQGPGFAISHFAYSLMYEQALQAVNPAVSLAYWDFTYESTLYDPDTFRNSLVFSDDWFGDARCENDLHTPLTGRFKKVPVMRHAENFSAISSPYGYLKSPWNNDPYPFMSRSGKIYDIANNLKPSGCSEYDRSLLFRDWMSLGKALNSDTHGHIHELMGGSWGFKPSIDVPSNENGYQAAYEFAHGTEAWSKILWRYNYMTCPTKATNAACDPDNLNEDYTSKTGGTCECTCTNAVWQNSDPGQLLYDLGIISSLTFYDKDGNAISKFTDSSGGAYKILPGYTKAETMEIYKEILTIICDAGNIGDMFQSTSTNDITFWLLHPTMERLWHVVRFNSVEGIYAFNDTWIDSEITCSGHYSYSNVPFKNLFDSDNTPYTNVQLYNLLHPQNPKLPYTYSHFKWLHCTFLEYPMNGF